MSCHCAVHTHNTISHIDSVDLHARDLVFVGGITKTFLTTLYRALAQYSLSCSTQKLFLLYAQTLACWATLFFCRSFDARALLPLRTNKALASLSRGMRSNQQANTETINAAMGLFND